MQLLKDLSANSRHEMDANAVQFVNSPKPETRWDSQPGRGLCHLICGKSQLMFKGHSYRHPYTYIYTSCIKALISACLIRPSSSVIMAFSRGVIFIS